MAAKKKTKKVEEQEDAEERQAKDLVLEGRNKFQFYKDSRRKYDWDWMVRNLYLRGYHHASYNKRSNTVVFGNNAGVRLPINLVWAHMRAVRNQTTSFRPKWEVLPSVTTDSSIENARYSQKLLDYIHDKASINRAIKEVVTQALWSSVGIWQIGIRDDGSITVKTIDPFDFYIDPTLTSADINDPENGAEAVIKAASYPLSVVQNNPHYQNTEKIEADNQTASAEYKQFLHQVVRARASRENDEAPTVIVKEMWKRERSDDGTFSMKIVTFCDQVDVPLRVEETDDQEYPFEIYQGDLTPNEVYGESWLKHIIPINRVIDHLESHIFEYNHLFARGRFVIDKNSGVRVIVNQHGQIIEKNRGSEVTSLPIAPLPTAPREQIGAMRQYLEDISGAHDVTLGRIPSGVKSGVGIAELRQADASNQNDLVDNLEEFLARAGKKILKLVAENWDSAQLIQVTGIGGKPDYFMAVGEKGGERLKKKDKYKFGDQELPIATIGADNEVRVKVGSWLAYTKEARQEKILEYFRLGLIDAKTALEYLEFSGIDDIVSRTRDEQLLQMRAGMPSKAVARTTGREDIDDEELALAENELMLEGNDQPVDMDDDHQVHIAVHKDVSDDKKFGVVVRAHINEHINQLKFQQREQTRLMEQGPPPEAGPTGAPPTTGTPPTNGAPPVPQGVPTPDALLSGLLGGGGPIA